MANTFIGIGKNPDGPDLPLGLGMELAQNPQAMNTVGSMSNAEKSALIRHVKGAATGEEAKSRMNQAINSLNHGQTQF